LEGMPPPLAVTPASSAVLRLVKVALLPPHSVRVPQARPRIPANLCQGQLHLCLVCQRTGMVQGVGTSPGGRLPLALVPLVLAHTSR
jgi:hypothetical protein